MLGVPPCVLETGQSAVSLRVGSFRAQILPEQLQEVPLLHAALCSTRSAFGQARAQVSLADVLEELRPASGTADALRRAWTEETWRAFTTFLRGDRRVQLLPRVDAIRSQLIELQLSAVTGAGSVHTLRQRIIAESDAIAEEVSDGHGAVVLPPWPHLPDDDVTAIFAKDVAVLARLRGCVEAAVGAPSERLLLPCVLLASALRAGSVLDRALAEVARLIPEVVLAPGSNPPELALLTNAQLDTLSALLAGSDGGRAILASQAASLTSRSAASLEDYARALAAAPADGHYAVLEDLPAQREVVRPAAREQRRPLAEGVQAAPARHYVSRFAQIAEELAAQPPLRVEPAAPRDDDQRPAAELAERLLVPPPVQPAERVSAQQPAPRTGDAWSASAPVDRAGSALPSALPAPPPAARPSTPPATAPPAAQPAARPAPRPAPRRELSPASWSSGSDDGWSLQAALGLDSPPRDRQRSTPDLHGGRPRPPPRPPPPHVQCVETVRAPRGATDERPAAERVLVYRCADEARREAERKHRGRRAASELQRRAADPSRDARQRWERRRAIAADQRSTVRVRAASAKAVVRAGADEGSPPPRQTASQSPEPDGDEKVRAAVLRAKRRAVDGEKKLREEKYRLEHLKDATRDELFAKRDERLQRFVHEKMQRFKPEDMLGGLKGKEESRGSLCSPLLSSSAVSPEVVRLPSSADGSSPAFSTPPEIAVLKASPGTSTSNTPPPRYAELPDQRRSESPEVVEEESAEPSARKVPIPLGEIDNPLVEDGFCVLTTAQAAEAADRELWELSRYLPRRGISKPAAWLRPET